MRRNPGLGEDKMVSGRESRDLNAYEGLRHWVWSHRKRKRGRGGRSLRLGCWGQGHLEGLPPCEESVCSRMAASWGLPHTQAVEKSEWKPQAFHRRFTGPVRSRVLCLRGTSRDVHQSPFALCTSFLQQEGSHTPSFWLRAQSVPERELCGIPKWILQSALNLKFWPGAPPHSSAVFLMSGRLAHFLPWCQEWGEDWLGFDEVTKYTDEPGARDVI